MASQLHLASWPSWLSRWIGYRTSPPPKPPRYAIWLWSFIGAFAGLSILQAVFGHAAYFVDRGVPSIIASYGAAAVLCYAAIEVPLAQPRALIAGHVLSALCGICITKLFSLLLDPQRFDKLRWLAGSLSAATAIVVMQVTETTHPPGGAAALLAAVDPEITHIGWYYLPVVMLSSMLMLVVALIVNNFQRRYPVFWFEPSISVPTSPSPALEKESSTVSSSSTPSLILKDNGVADSNKQSNTLSTAV